MTPDTPVVPRGDERAIVFAGLPSASWWPQYLPGGRPPDSPVSVRAGLIVKTAIASGPRRRTVVPRGTMTLRGPDRWGSADTADIPDKRRKRRGPVTGTLSHGRRMPLFNRGASRSVPRKTRVLSGSSRSWRSWSSPSPACTSRGARARRAGARGVSSVELRCSPARSSGCCSRLGSPACSPRGNGQPTSSRSQSSVLACLSRAWYCRDRAKAR